MQQKIAGVLKLDDPSKLTSLGLRGGNANFQLTLTQADYIKYTQDLGCQQHGKEFRCSDSNLHFGVTAEGVYWVHMDSADPYDIPRGSIKHGILDYWFGHWIWNNGVPH
jgi:hypothetical protein